MPCPRFLAAADLADAILLDSQQTSPQALSVPPAVGSGLCMDASGFFQAARCGSTDSDAGYYTTAFRFLIKHRNNSSTNFFTFDLSVGEARLHHVSSFSEVLHDPLS
jgi:hypothetical protein